MKVILIANGEQEKEFKSSMTDESLQLTTISALRELEGINAQVCIDLQFENSEDRRKRLEGTGAKLIIVNYVPGTLEKLGSRYVRINGWNSFLRRTIVEASAGDKELEKIAVDVISRFGKRIEWVPDIPGFITSRVVAQIINEAYFSIEEEVSTREDIDTAMKLGTNYPYGPFEWANIIGLDKVATLLNELARTAPRYQPSGLLMKESGC